jgi:hypothetical protein
MKLTQLTPSSGKKRVIIPPQEIRQEIETTAKYVAQYGRDFEKIIISKEVNNPIFSFINIDDPYRAYYDQKVFSLTF